MTFSEIKAQDDNFVAGTYARSPLFVCEADGAKFIDDEGCTLIDFSAGIGVVSVGHCNPKWTKAVADQAARLAHTSNLYYTQPMAELARKLCGRTGLRRAFFANSGAEVNEGALKTARKYMSDNHPGRDTVLCLLGSFHGRTIATLSATGQESFHKHFGPWLPGLAFAAPNDIAQLREKCTENVGAIFLECIQGEGGVVPLTESFLGEVAEICRSRDILLMVDEIQTGVGRTGKFLCCEHYGLAPDVVTLAKGLGGGLPIGAVLFGEKTMHTLGKGDHGSTFGGNLICCAGANAVLDILDEALLREVAEKGDYLRAKLEDLPGITGVDGKGLMLGASLGSGLTNTAVIAECLERGLVLLSAKEKLRFLPPLTITKDELDTGLAILADVLQ